MARIHAASRGFTYLVSVTGVTGVRTNLDTRVGALVGQLKDQGATPVAVGLAFPAPTKPGKCATGVPMAPSWAAPW